jgi:cytochrome c oxidase assembly protein subunit 15
MPEATSRRTLAIWLFSVCALIALMVVVGGLTRLTGSGLSITEWKPIHGALPPLSIEEWNQEFEAYKQIPQYQQLNKGMTLDEFKDIFWWEWGHRNLGRLIGFAFLIPFLVFWFRGMVERVLVPRLLFLFVLGGMQGALGWFMVASGLSERTSVSQYRLVAHLGLALLIYMAIFLTALPLWRREWPAVKTPHPLYRYTHVIVALVFCQILLGGFVAGLDAGLTYNTWPLMDGAIIPQGVYTSWLSSFEDVTTVQFNHRMLAYLVFAAIVALFVQGLRQGLNATASRTSLLLLAAVSLQVLLGIWTLLAVVPVWLGAMHQFGAVLLLSAALLHTDSLRRNA